MSHALVAKADAGIATLRDLSGKRVAVDAGSVADSHLFYEGLQRDLHKGHKGQEEAFRAVVADEAPAALLWLPVASWLARGNPELHVIPVSDPRLEFPIGAGVDAGEGPNRSGSFDLCHHLFALPWGRGHRGRPGRYGSDNPQL